MVLRVLKGVSLHTIHTAFRWSEFELHILNHDNAQDDDDVAIFEDFEAQLAAAEDHEMVEEERRLIEEFSSFRLGNTAVHPEPNPENWPPPEGADRDTPRVNCLRHLFSDIFNDPDKMLEDCILLVNRVQRHKCNRRYCIR